MTQKISNSIIFTLLVLQGKVVTGEVGDLPLPCSIQIGSLEDVSEWIVVCADHKLIPILPIWRQILMELFGDSPLES